MTVTTSVDMQELNKKAGQALEDTTADFLDLTEVVFTRKQWGWPNETVRQNGTIAGTMRDVVDTQRLQNEVQVQRINSLTFEVHWTAPYAAAVFLGAVFKVRAFSMPARNVPLAALKELDIEATFAKHLGRYL